MATHRATVFAAVPTMYGALLTVPDRESYDVSALRLCLSGGAALPVEVLSLNRWISWLVDLGSVRPHVTACGIG